MRPRRRACEALELAEALELDELRASARTTLGVVSMVRGELVGNLVTHYLEVVAGPTRSSEQVRALTNLAVLDDSTGSWCEACDATHAWRAKPRRGWATGRSALDRVRCDSGGATCLREVGRGAGAGRRVPRDVASVG